MANQNLHLSDKILTWPNVLSGLRLALVPVFLWLILIDENLLAFSVLAFSSFTDWLDGYHCVFGELIEGENILKQIELAGSRSGTPSSKIVIEECGEVKAEPAK